MTDEQVEEIFGKDFKEKMEEQVENNNDDEIDEINIRLRSITNCVNKAWLDTEYILANIDVEEHPEQFEFLETLYQALQEAEEKLSTEQFKELTEKDYSNTDDDIDEPPDPNNLF